MNGKKIGYVRVSTEDQNHERQLHGLELDKMFIDHASGRDTERPQLMAMLDYVRDGDIVYVHSMYRFARNLVDLRNLVEQLTNEKVEVVFVTENLKFDGADNPMSRLLLSVMGAAAEFELAKIKERQMEGIALAKKRGVYKGRKPSLNDEQIALLQERVAKGDKKAHIARDLGISRETVYQYIKKVSSRN